MGIKTWETVIELELPEELESDAVEAMFLERYIDRAIEKLVVFGSRMSGSVGDVWSRLRDEAKKQMGDEWSDSYELSFDHITRKVCIKKRKF